jgi:hypothetical protein
MGQDVVVMLAFRSAWQGDLRSEINSLGSMRASLNYLVTLAMAMVIHQPGRLSVWWNAKVLVHEVSRVWYGGACLMHTDIPCCAVCVL